MESYISVYTLRRLNNLLDEYKKRIIKDFYEINELSVDYQKIENKYLERENIKIPFKHSLDPEKCNAYVFNKYRGKVQCRNSIKTGRFCMMHKNNQNYGIINFL